MDAPNRSAIVPAMKKPSIDLSRVALKRRRTKIVATVGPSSAAEEILRELVTAGVNVFRLNFSHGSHESHGELYARIRKVAEEEDRHVAILADLCGPKIRVGRFEDGAITLAQGERVRISVTATRGRPGLIPSEYTALVSDAEPGDRILLDDGNLELRVVSVEETELSCEVIQGGLLKDRKGMNLPGVAVSAPALTEKDKADAHFAAGLGVDYMALSFVRASADIEALRAHLAEVSAEIPIIAKIEKPEALEVISAILDEADGVMVARGDLGVEMPAEEVPLIQKELIRLAIHANKPVIVATQMLDSMIENPRPTRAEVTDVAAAAWAGADAVMLSGETASGAFPVRAVETMDRVLRKVEGYEWKRGQFDGLVSHRAFTRAETPVVDRLDEAISRATSQLSRELMVRTIATPVISGKTARMVSAERPAAPVLALTSRVEACRRLALFWGVLPVVADVSDLDTLRETVRREARERGLAEPGEPILLVWNAGRGSARRAPTISILEA